MAMGRRQGRAVAGLLATALGLGAALGASACGNPGATAAVAPTSPAGASSCLDLDEHGEPRWTGRSASPPDPGVVDALQSIGNTHPDEVAGVAICSDGSSVAIYLSPARAAARAKAVDAASRNPGVVRVVEVPHSLEDQLAAMDAVRTLPKGRVQITGWGPQPFTGGLSVRLVPVDGTAEDIEAQRGPDVAEVRARLRAVSPGDMPVRFQRGDGAGVLL